MQCPECKQEIGRSAYCGCGWRKSAHVSDFPKESHINCAYENCFLSAKVRIRTKTGLANLCWQHYDKHFAQQAVDNLDKYGMERKPDETRAEHVMRMREFVKSGFKSFASAKRMQADEAKP